MCYFDLRSPFEPSTTSQYVPIVQQASSTFAPFIIALSEADKEALRAMIREVVTEFVRDELRRLRKDDDSREEQ